MSGILLVITIMPTSIPTIATSRDVAGWAGKIADRWRPAAIDLSLEEHRNTDVVASGHAAIVELLFELPVIARLAPQLLSKQW